MNVQAKYFFTSVITFFFFFKQKTAYEIRKGDWSSDVCSSDLPARVVTADLLDGLHGYKIPLAFLLLGEATGATIEFGTWAPSDEEVPVATLDEREALVQTVLE